MTLLSCYYLPGRNPHNTKPSIKSFATITNFNFISVAIDGDVTVVGAYSEDSGGLNSGAAYIFEKDNVTGEWTESIKLVASDAAVGDRFGGSVAVDGSVVVVGASGNDDGGSNSGSAYIFEKDNATGQWNEVTKLVASDATAGDSFGSNVAIDGNLLVVAAEGGDGSVYVYEQNKISGA